MSDSSRPHGLQPTRLLRPWDFPGKSTGVGCHCLLCISHASKVMIKILQARLQQYVNQELPDVQTGIRKGRGARDHIANIRGIIDKTMIQYMGLHMGFPDGSDGKESACDAVEPEFNH